MRCLAILAKIMVLMTKTMTIVLMMHRKQQTLSTVLRVKFVNPYSSYIDTFDNLMEYIVYVTITNYCYLGITTACYLCMTYNYCLTPMMK